MGIDWSGQDQRVGIAASQFRLRFVSRSCAQPVAAGAWCYGKRHQQGYRNWPMGLLTLNEHAPPEAACSIVAFALVSFAVVKT